jgi:hypothetical protein
MTASTKNPAAVRWRLRDKLGKGGSIPCSATATELELKLDLSQMWSMLYLYVSSLDARKEPWNAFDIRWCLCVVVFCR